MTDFTEKIEQANKADMFRTTIKLLEEARTEGMRYATINTDGTLDAFHQTETEAQQRTALNGAEYSTISDFIRFCRMKRDEINSGLCAIGGLIVYFYICQENVIEDIAWNEGLSRDHTIKGYLKKAKREAAEYMDLMRRATKHCNPDVAQYFEECYSNITQEIQREFIIAQCTSSNEISGMGGKANDHPKLTGTILALLIILNIMRDCREESQFKPWIMQEKSRKNLGYIFERLTGIPIKDLRVSPNVNNAMYLMMQKIYNIATIERRTEDFTPIE